MGKDNSVLLRGHGCVVVGSNLKEAVLNAVYFNINASLVLQSMQLGDDVPRWSARLRPMSLWKQLQRKPDWIAIPAASSTHSRQAGAGSCDSSRRPAVSVKQPLPQPLPQPLLQSLPPRVRP